jgi:hypothetical protein
LEWVDRENPDASRLLTAPIDAHGSADGAIFPDHQADQFQRLVDWVYQVAQKDPPPNTPNQANPLIPGQSPSQSAVQPAVHTVPTLTGPGRAFQIAPGVVPPNVPLASQRFNPGSVRLGQDAWPTPERTSTAPITTPHPLPSADPFDPEVFNRTFHR